LTRSFDRLSELSPGFRPDGVLSARISPPIGAYASGPRTSAFYDEVLQRLSATPGVSAVGLVDQLPIAAPVFGIGIRVEGQAEDGSQRLPSADHIQSVTPGYLRAMGIPVLRGRGIEEADRAETLPVAVVSQSLARRFWPNDDPIGKRIGHPYPSPWITVVGVMADVKLDSLRDTLPVAVVLPLAQRSRFARAEMSIVIRSSADPVAVARRLREVVASIDRTVPVSSVRTMREVVAQSVERPRFTMVVVGGFALAALLLGATGIYGVMSYVVSQRSHEMGVRAALGATSGDIARIVVGRGACLAAAGAGVGCVLALLGTRMLGALLYGVSPSDPTTYVAVAVVFVTVAVAACVGPALRAMRADPVQTLREG
jgi:putative ABC transport system permease protein